MIDLHTLDPHTSTHARTHTCTDEKGMRTSDKPIPAETKMQLISTNAHTPTNAHTHTHTHTHVLE
jgi:hypothetical protein